MNHKQGHQVRHPPPPALRAGTCYTLELFPASINTGSLMKSPMLAPLKSIPGVPLTGTLLLEKQRQPSQATANIVVQHVPSLQLIAAAGVFFLTTPDHRFRSLFGNILLVYGLPPTLTGDLLLCTSQVSPIPQNVRFTAAKLRLTAFRLHLPT
jgi:hypothetical protein